MNFKYIAFCFGALFFALGCAKQNTSIIGQTYHDLTGHYNTYFNGNEIYSEAIKTIEKSRQENYDTIIPLFAYGTIEDTKSQSGQFTAAITKAEKTVQLHQVKEKSKNYQSNEDNTITNWADDAFLLIGKSYYMSGEYDKSIRSLRYITAHFDESVDSRSKKKIKKQRNNKKRKAKAKKKAKKLVQQEKDGKDVRPSKSLFAHEAAKSEALIWLVKSYTANGEYESADAVLTHIRSDKTFLKNFDAHVSLAAADLKLQQGNITAAAQNLEEALLKIKRKKEKARYQFVLAQLYEESNNNALAAYYFEESSKGNPNFEMAFYAKFKLIEMSHDSEESKEKADKLISKMLKDGKNREYRDLLYYEQALFALEDNRREDAKDLLQKSIDKSTTNKLQKGRSFQLLADLNYEEEEYVLAQAYYDSTLSLIDRSYDGFDFVSNRSSVLTELVEHLNTITLNDSVLLVASFSEDEREDFIYQLALDQIEKEDKEKVKASSIASIQDKQAVDSKKAKGQWYFYSESTRNSGKKKFQQIWGDRPLEDNWRRSSKDSGDDFTENEESGSSDFYERVDERAELLMANIPLTDEDKDKLLKDVESAYYGAAITYRVGLDNTTKAIQYFEKFVSLYETSTYLPETYYNLYLLYGEVGNSAKEKKYKDLLLKQFPKSDFAKVIENPNYFNEQNKVVEAARAYYEETYAMYIAENFDEVINRSEDAQAKFPNNNLQAKFDLIKAMAIGGKKLVEPFKASLRYVIANHKSTEEEAKATEMLAYLNGESPSQKQDKAEEKKSKLQQKNSGQIKSDKERDLDSKSKGDKSKPENDGFKIKLGEKEIQFGGDKDTPELGPK